MTRPRVLQLVGSAVSDELSDLSLLYATDCLEATADVAESIVARVSPDRSWRFPETIDAEAEPVPVADAVARIEALDVDAVVPQMFCLPGMVEYRALFEVLGIPLLGNRAETMALAADKARCKAVVAAAGVAVPAGVVVDDELGEAPDPPVVVKPVDGDNSDGVTLVTDPAGLGPAIDEARRHGRAALVEAYVAPGREVRAATLERDGELCVLPLEEYAVDARSKPIRDAADKLGRGAGGALALVAKDDAHAWIVDDGDPVVPVVAEAARRCHVALGCRDYGLFDFRIDPAGRPWFLEAGLYCSFARQSVVATMARAAGIEIEELFQIVCDRALARAPERSRT